MSDVKLEPVLELKSLEEVHLYAQKRKMFKAYLVYVQTDEDQFYIVKSWGGDFTHKTVDGAKLKELKRLVPEWRRRHLAAVTDYYKPEQSELVRLRARLKLAHDYLLAEWKANALRGPMGDELIASLNEKIE